VRQHPHEVQAVCCATVNDSSIVAWFAMSREDKTLSLYYTAPSSSGTTTTMTMRLVRPTMTYDVTRRARCLAFATVPLSSSSSSPGNCLVVIAGDMSGNTWAFPVQDHPAEVASLLSSVALRQLLLGHTASILTGLNVVHRADDDVTSSSSRGRRRQ
jgi:hypothetical protein